MDPKVQLYWKRFKLGLFHQGLNSSAVFLSRTAGNSDVFYLPARYQDAFYHIGKVFADNTVFCAIAVNRIAAVCGWLDFFKNGSSDLPGTFLWGSERNDWTRKMLDDEMFYLHPVKMSGFEQNLSQRNCYCQTYMKLFFKALGL